MRTVASSILLFAGVAMACDSRLLSMYAQNFFDACEAGKGWSGVSPFVNNENATFSAQVTDSLPGDKLSEVKTVKDYAEWMVGVVKEFGPKATVEIKAKAIDTEKFMVIWYAVFAGFSDYVYSVSFSPDCKVTDMTKIWNDGYAAKHAPP